MNTVTSQSQSRVLSIATAALRILSGLALFIFGLNKFLNFIPMEPANEAVGAAFAGLFATGYIMPVVAVVEVLAGISFLTNKLVPLMAVILAPISFNLVAFHLTLDMAGILPALIIALANILLIVKYKERFMPIIKG